MKKILFDFVLRQSFKWRRAILNKYYFIDSGGLLMINSNLKKELSGSLIARLIECL